MARKSGKSGTEPDFVEQAEETMPEIDVEVKIPEWEEEEEPRYNSEPVVEPLVTEVSPAPVNTTPEPFLSRDMIINSRFFKKYQRDFVKSLLPNSTYQVSEAKRIVTEYFNGKEGK